MIDHTWKMYYDLVFLHGMTWNDGLAVLPGWQDGSGQVSKVLDVFEFSVLTQQHRLLTICYIVYMYVYKKSSWYTKQTHSPVSSVPNGAQVCSFY